MGGVFNKKKKKIPYNESFIINPVYKSTKSKSKKISIEIKKTM